MKTFSPDSFPLHGRRLIEASAGTGKTYQIANLYLRLLLESESPLTVDQILVVTFTRAATHELRGRIRDKIEQALQAFLQPVACNDGFIRSLLEKYPGKDMRANVCRRLNTALVSMDEASIFTIHGFAVQVIRNFLFETGTLAEVELTEGDNYRLEQVLGDLWRCLQLNDSEPLRPYIEALAFKNPEDFRKYFSRIPMRAEILPAFDISTPPESLQDLLPQLEKFFSMVVDKILTERNRLRTIWKEICDKNTAETLKVLLGDSGNSKLFEKIDGLLASSETKLSVPTGKMGERLLKIGISGEETPLAVFVRELVKHIEASISREDIMKNAGLALLFQWLRATLSEPQLSSMQLDDVIRLINSILAKNNPASHNLRRVMKENYPVCLVDECQDTDPEQFELFNQVYGDGASGNNNGIGFFMIGDPKQSIYAFRGADIFSYLDVRAQVDTGHIFTLDTNFRSKASLVNATNHLFAERENHRVFLYEGITFRPVRSCEDESPGQDKGSYDAPDASQSLVFIGNPADPANSNGKFQRDYLQRHFARDTAQRIAALLHPDSGAKITRGNNSTLLRAGDIAILVRNGTEARVMREELLRLDPPILTVYQSQRDSVFSAAVFAEDLYHILAAMEAPADKQRLKVALGTLLYRGFRADFRELDALQNDEGFYEMRIAEFHRYHYEWQHHGVLSALGSLMAERKLAEAFARQAEGDRLLTDFRHLGELLQQQAQACSSAEELLVWYARQLRDDSGVEADSKRIRLESDENLVKIVTIHVSKGLQYPVVFLPFFFFPRPVDLSRDLPFFHCAVDGHCRPRLDFSSPLENIENAMSRESLAEEMRLLYVAITRAVYQCYIGISSAVSGRPKKNLFPDTVWAHLLDIADENPSWEILRSALQKKFAACENTVAYRELDDIRRLVPAPRLSHVSIASLVDEVTLPPLPSSRWVLTSYTALANARRDPGFRHGASDEQGIAADRIVMEERGVEDRVWQENIRYRLQGSSTTGDCLHAIYETLAQSPGSDLLAEVQTQLQRYGLSGNLETQDKMQDIANWIAQTLDVPLMAGNSLLTLHHLYAQRKGLPELAFDFSLGNITPASIEHGINTVLHRCQLAGITLPGLSEIEGFMTGSLDFLFIHDKKVYVLDYKSNLLGKAPHFYDRPNMDRAMQEHRYDLQYMIYAVAAHRYMQQRLGARYAFDQGEYSFGGVFYLFVRGMGLKEYPGHGIWFHRPAAQQILALDAAFKGEQVEVQGA